MASYFVVLFFFLEDPKLNFILLDIGGKKAMKCKIMHPMKTQC